MRQKPEVQNNYAEDIGWGKINDQSEIKPVDTINSVIKDSELSQFIKPEANEQVLNPLSAMK